MARPSVLHVSPEKIVWIGAFVLSVGFFFGLPFAWNRTDYSGLSFQRPRKAASAGVSSCHFSLGLCEKLPLLPVPNLQGEMTFSFDPPWPDAGVPGKRVFVRIKHSGASKRVILPCRLDLEFQGDKLHFAGARSLFWLELALDANERIAAKSCISAVDGETIEAESFTLSGDDCPFQGPQEFLEGSAFRGLAEAKWWGQDQFKKGGESGERLEIGSSFLEIRQGDWLVWKNGKWEKSEELEKDLPIAHIESISSKALILEGWDANGHTRMMLSSAISTPYRVKGEDLFGAIRIRSEKQISCTLEKQCMVLRMGDWVLKSDGKWKILRKKEDRDAFLNGKLFGELFILEQISQKQGQKMIQGRLFNPGRTQVVSIEIAALSTRKAKEKNARKGRF